MRNERDAKCGIAAAALGNPPAASIEYRLDRNLWIKRPGKSDSDLRRRLPAGNFGPEYALGFAARATG